ncbi:MAG: hypothetical protein WC501_05675 [Candidatus Micrarchaeia archaeon]|jgi:hypothetical protein
MLNFLRGIMGNSKISGEEFITRVSILEIEATKSFYSHSSRKNVLDLSKTLMDACRYDRTIMTPEGKEKVLSLLNKVKVSALTQGTQKDYNLFIQLDNISKELERFE